MEFIFFPWISLRELYCCIYVYILGVYVCRPFTIYIKPNSCFGIISLFSKLSWRDLIVSTVYNSILLYGISVLDEALTRWVIGSFVGLYLPS